jgi:arylsulfatase A-like enzyme
MDPHARYYLHPFNGEYGSPANDPRGKNLQFYSSAYQGEIVFTDVHLSRLIEYLKSTGLYDSAVIFFTADHGQEMFDHYFWGHSTSMYEEQIHIPLIIKLPENRYASTVNESLVSQIDFAPTLLHIAGIPRPDGWDGHNMLNEDFFNNCVISQSLNSNFEIAGIRTLHSKWIESEPGFSSVRSGQSRFVPIDPRAAFPEKNYFDLIDDPKEMNNLYGKTEYQAEIDSIIKLGLTTTSLMSVAVEEADSAVLDEETIRRLKELGYLK